MQSQNMSATSLPFVLSQISLSPCAVLLRQRAWCCRMAHLRALTPLQSWGWTQGFTPMQKPKSASMRMDWSSLKALQLRQQGCSAGLVALLWTNEILTAENEPAPSNIFQHTKPPVFISIFHPKCKHWVWPFSAWISGPDEKNSSPHMLFLLKSAEQLRYIFH